ncbi:putative transferase [Helianthus debilis subsp. tardiflorus]
MSNTMSMLYGTTARGWKWMDTFYFLMNPMCASGKLSHDVANYIQPTIGSSLSYECTNFTRKEKYKILAGNDGTMDNGNHKVDAGRIMGC